MGNCNAVVGRLLTSSCNVGYDLLTIFISIADVATDIIVLVGFYQKERTTFFVISLCILILAQCSYALAFSARFRTIDELGVCGACLCFCCVLPFGSFVAFLIYLSSEESAFSCLSDCVSVETMFDVSTRDSALTKWIKKKLDKHMGFILEAAIEAFPQSLLQITAIVYFQEANVVSILSILISMFSVMTKSLILSQGAEKTTFVWSWLCMVIDFFSIFFTLTWVFYSSEIVPVEFLEFFNLFGFIWLCKFAASVGIPVAIGLVIFVGFGYWRMLYTLYDEEGRICKMSCCGWSLLWLVFSPVLAVVVAFGASIMLEVFCFAFAALFVYTTCTDRISKYSQASVSECVQQMLQFIRSGRSSQDRKLRVMSVNFGLNRAEVQKTTKDKRQNIVRLVTYIERTIDEDENGDNYAKLKRVTYQDIREHSGNPRKANLCRDMRMSFASTCSEVADIDGCEDCVECFAFSFMFFFMLPTFVLCKLLQIAFPWIIVGYLLANHSVQSIPYKIDVFQLCMLGIEMLLQVVWFALSVRVYRINYWLWHVNPGASRLNVSKLGSVGIIQNSLQFYQRIQWLPLIRQTVEDKYGNDIGRIIMQYYNQIQIEN